MSRGGRSAAGSLSSAGSCTPICWALAMRAGPMPMPEGAQALAHHLGVHRPIGHRTRGDGRPGSRVAGRGAREDVVEGAGRGVPLRERLTQSPGPPQRGDQGGVEVLLARIRVWRIQIGGHGVRNHLALSAVLRPPRNRVAQVLADGPVEVLAIPGAAQVPSTLSSERFSNRTTTM
jgi:hypothetical protein